MRHLPTAYDKLYTKPQIARQCIEAIEDLETYDCIIEPAAGDGSFSLLLDCIVYDIKPEHPSIVEQDSLKISQVFPSHTIAVGNPPFGERGRLANAFIKHCVELGAESIAFILPDTFFKLSKQKVFPPHWHLKKTLPLPAGSFTVGIEEHDIPCSFFYWTIRDVKIDLREIEYPPASEFEFLPREDDKADFTINGNTGKVKDISEVRNPKAEHYIKAYSSRVRGFFESATYDFYSSIEGKNAWIGQQEILKHYHKNWRAYE